MANVNIKQAILNANSKVLWLKFNRNYIIQLIAMQVGKGLKCEKK